MNAREHYEVLGLVPFAGGARVDQAYWHLARGYQDLAITDPRAREALDELNRAYAVLSTPRLREAYDATLSGSVNPGVVGGPSGRPKAPRSRWTLRLPHLALPALPPVLRSRANDAATEPGSMVISAPSRASNPRLRAVPTSRANIKDLRDSTAQMLERWRANANIQTDPQGAQGAPPHPDSTLVDIFKTENQLTLHDDPLAAVMEILKAPADVIAAAGPDPSRR